MLFDMMLGSLTPTGFAFALVIGFVGGLVKGIVGFAMPMIIISGLSAILAPDVALAALILPTLATNILQAFRHGVRAAFQAVGRFRVFLLTGFVFMVGSAQLVLSLPRTALFLLIGVPVFGFALMQLVGWRATLHAPSKKIEMAVGGFAGFVGGLSGVWGPPTVAYLTAINTPKVEQMRVQGVIYGLGALVLTFAHLQSGVLRAETIPLSLAMIAPAMLGMVVGLRVQDRIDQARFKQVTLAVLLIAGLNLIRRGLF